MIILIIAADDGHVAELAAIIIDFKASQRVLGGGKHHCFGIIGAGKIVALVNLKHLLPAFQIQPNPEAKPHGAADLCGQIADGVSNGHGLIGFGQALFGSCHHIHAPAVCRPGGIQGGFHRTELGIIEQHPLVEQHG